VSAFKVCLDILEEKGDRREKRRKEREERGERKEERKGERREKEERRKEKWR
jgi:hypothetical protein